MILIQDNYTTFTDCKKRTIPEKMLQIYLYIHISMYNMYLSISINARLWRGI